jgi:hypothetical protein
MVAKILAVKEHGTEGLLFLAGCDRLCESVLVPMVTPAEEED